MRAGVETARAGVGWTDLTGLTHGCDEERRPGVRLTMLNGMAGPDLEKALDLHLARGIRDLGLKDSCDGVLEGRKPELGSLEFALKVMKVYEAALVSEGERVAVD